MPVPELGSRSEGTDLVEQQEATEAFSVDTGVHSETPSDTRDKHAINGMFIAYDRAVHASNTAFSVVAHHCGTVS